MASIRYCKTKFGANHFELISKPTRNVFRNVFQFNDQSFFKNKFLIKQHRNSLVFQDQPINFLHISKLFLNNSFRGFKKHDGQNKNDNNEAKQKCYFDIANFGLLETFGAIGAAVMVGIDIHSRINQYNTPNAVIKVFDPIIDYQSMFNNVSDLFKFNCKSFFDDAIGTSILNNCCGSCNLCYYLYNQISSKIDLKTFFPLSNYGEASVLNIFADKTSGEIFSNKIIENNHATTASTLQLSNINRTNTVNTIENGKSKFALLFEEISSDESEDEVHQTETKCNNKNSNNKKINRNSCVNYDNYNLTNYTNQPIINNQNDKNLFENSNSNQYSSNEQITSAIEESDEELEWTTSSGQIDLTEAHALYFDYLNNRSALELMASGRPTEAMQCWSSCKSSSAALFNMAVAYESGRQEKNGKPDMNLAYHYYVKAALKYHPLAIYNLALFYLYGKGSIEKDSERGLRLLRIASSLGIEEARNYCQLYDTLTENHDNANSSNIESKNEQKNADDQFVVKTTDIGLKTKTTTTPLSISLSDINNKLNYFYISDKSLSSSNVSTPISSTSSLNNIQTVKRRFSLPNLLSVN